MPGKFIESPPRSFYAIGILALIWNILGVVQYVMRVTMTDTAIAALSESQQAFIAATPSWALAAFATATNVAVLGCLALLLKKAWAYPLFIVSLLALLVQDFHGYALADGMAAFGAGGVVLTALILVITVYLVWYAKQASNKGWIN
jgi:hypothetical protein